MSFSVVTFLAEEVFSFSNQMNSVEDWMVEHSYLNDQNQKEKEKTVPLPSRYTLTILRCKNPLNWWNQSQQDR